MGNSAYPTQIGNTVIAGHVYLPNGSDGPFANLDQLKWGDQIVLQQDGFDYIYEVRNRYTTTPTDLGVLDEMDDYDWLTLITCSDYNPRTTEFMHRNVVVAVRVK